jgi:hypothetical protein
VKKPISAGIRTASNERRTFLAGLLILVAGGVVAAFGVPRIGAPSQVPKHMEFAATPEQTEVPTEVSRPEATAIPVRRRDFGAWRYSATRDFATSPIQATVEYDKQSIDALQRYAAANRAWATDLAGLGSLVEAVVTFRRTIDPDQFRNWAISNGMSVSLAALRTIEGQSMRGGIGIAGTSTDPLPQSEIGRLPPHGRIEGVYAAHGTILASRLPAVIRDPLVFLIDVTPTRVRQDLIAAGIADGEAASVTTGSPFWDMEDFGLDNFR